MSVSKIKANDKNEIFLTVDSYDEIDKSEFKKYMDLDSPYFLKCYFANDDTFTLFYSNEKYTSLKEYLSREIRKANALDFLKSLTEVYIEADKHALNPKNILLGVQSVFVVPETDKVACVYVPVVEGTLSERPLRLFVKELLVNMLYSEEDDMTWLGELIRYINRNRNLELESFYKFLGTLENINSTKQVSLDSEEKLDSVFLSNETEALSEGIENTIEEAALTLTENVVEETTEDDEFSMLKAAFNKMPVKPIEIENIDVDEQKEGNSEIEENVEIDDVQEEVMFSDTENPKIETRVTGYLYRRSTHTEHMLNNDVTRIGKSLDNEICIVDNPVISRFHASITWNGEDYLIRDHLSTNHTFVNGIVLKVDQEKMLSENDRIVLGNEEFVFKIK